MKHARVNPAERQLIARAAAHQSWASTPNRTARTARARDAFLARFVDQVDPLRELTTEERARRATSARTGVGSSTTTLGASRLGPMVGGALEVHGAGPRPQRPPAHRVLPYSLTGRRHLLPSSPERPVALRPDVAQPPYPVRGQFSESRPRV